ncbi:Zinc finger and SCAN domain-containing protein 29 [Chelonia mydas]|uniref:Zinc finger and SCAN domain-containing protein 29 n=1 Tax=Chelonia mydas TaxID=8469 RepID=M7B262_CHEMY|nr:Zinc finger and SCAN domain-containing protein 29 [Chelonia mydas]
MPAQGRKHIPAWSILETLDLIAVWGEESVQAVLRTSKRNADIYAKIAQGMGDKGYTRDTEQCRLKIRELRQAYQKTREANSCFGAKPQTCCFYEQLHPILGRDPTKTPTLSVDTSQGTQAATGNNEEDIVDEEEEEEEENAQQANGGSILPNSQYPFLTLEPIPSQDALVRDCGGGEGTSGRDLGVSKGASKRSQSRGNESADIVLQIMNSPPLSLRQQG